MRAPTVHRLPFRLFTRELFCHQTTSVLTTESAQLCLSVRM